MQSIARAAKKVDSLEFLSDWVIRTKYARFIPEKGRVETFNEIVTRDLDGHLEYYSHLPTERKVPLYRALDWAYQAVYEKLGLPAMRRFQWHPKYLKGNHQRAYNCAYANLANYRRMSDCFFNILNGVGNGYSVKYEHISQLPRKFSPNTRDVHVHVVGDSAAGWAEAFLALLESYDFQKNTLGRLIEFDYSQVRPKGSIITSMNVPAPGPEHLALALDKVRAIMDSVPEGSRLTPLQTHDIMCIMAKVAGFTMRRSAMISVFSPTDNEMMHCKDPEQAMKNPWRYGCNNTAALDANNMELSLQQFENIWKVMSDNGSGEPGIIFLKDQNKGPNPCGEVVLQEQFCNLVEGNAAAADSQTKLNDIARAMSIIATVQAGYTDLNPALHPEWKHNTERDRLIGVSWTGLANHNVMKLDFGQAAEVVKKTNVWISALLGNRPAIRTTCVKPAGSTSIVLKTSSGIHSWFTGNEGDDEDKAEAHWRRTRIRKITKEYRYVKKNAPALIEDCVVNPEHIAVFKCPIKAPKGSIGRRQETAIELLERIAHIHRTWVKRGHTEEGGPDTNSVSATVNIKDHEKQAVKEWMIKNVGNYNCLTVFPHSDHCYPQAPFSDMTEKEYQEAIVHLQKLNLSEIEEDFENRTEEHIMDNPACAGGKCELL